MHGIMSLEIEGVFDQVGVDAARLYDQEIKHLITHAPASRSGRQPAALIRRDARSHAIPLRCVCWKSSPYFSP